MTALDRHMDSGAVNVGSAVVASAGAVTFVALGAPVWMTVFAVTVVAVNLGLAWAFRRTAQ